MGLVKDGGIQNLLFRGNTLCSPPNYQLTGTTPDDLVRLVLEASKKAV